MKNTDFKQAIKEVEKEIKINKNRSNLKSPKSFSSSTPKIPEHNKNITGQSDSSLSLMLDKSVNTKIEFDKEFQLEAITDKCIELEKKLTV